MPRLKTKNPNIELVEPDIERDAPIAVNWLAGDIGRQTLRLMGNTDKNNKPSSLDEEKARIKGFIESEEQLTWMISLHENIIGTIWVLTDDTEYVSGPSIHFMIGDPDARGHGAGRAATQAVIDYLREEGKYQHLFSRHLMVNEGAKKLLESCGFEKLEEPYEDSDGLSWQNVALLLF